MSAAFSAKAKVAMSRFEPGSSIGYGKMHENIDIVRRRSAVASSQKTRKDTKNKVLVDLQPRL